MFPLNHPLFEEYSVALNKKRTSFETSVHLGLLDHIMSSTQKHQQNQQNALPDRNRTKTTPLFLVTSTRRIVPGSPAHFLLQRLCRKTAFSAKWAALMFTEIYMNHFFDLWWRTFSCLTSCQYLYPSVSCSVFRSSWAHAQTDGC